MYNVLCILHNQVAHTYSSRYFFLFLSLQFSVTNLSFSSDSGAIVRSSDSSNLILNIFFSLYQAQDDNTGCYSWSASGRY